MKNFFILVAGILCSISVFGQSAGEKLKFTHLTGDFYLFETYNNYKGNLISANGMYVVGNDGILMIDAPWDPTQYQPFLDSMESRHHKKVVMYVATHSHEDRAGDFDFFKEKGVKTYSSHQTDEILKDLGRKRSEFLFEKDTVFSLAPYSIQAYYPGPGHTKDNIVIWSDQEKILFGGCLVKSTEATDLGYIAEGDVEAWPKTIRNLKKKFKGVKYVIPGHDGWTNINSLDHTLELLEENEKKTSGK